MGIGGRGVGSRAGGGDRGAADRSAGGIDHPAANQFAGAAGENVEREVIHLVEVIVSIVDGGQQIPGITSAGPSHVDVVVKRGPGIPEPVTNHTVASVGAVDPEQHGIAAG